MADVEYELGRFRHNSAGIREVFQSEAMQAAVLEAAGRLASHANAIASTHSVRHRTPTMPAYTPNVYVGHDTALGFVNREKPDGFLDQEMYHTLDRVNH